MNRQQSPWTRTLLSIAVIFVVVAFVAACAGWRTKRDIDVTAKTAISGNVNGSPMEATVLATFNTGRGGSSTCTFTKLPTGFNPGSLGTHA